MNLSFSNFILYLAATSSSLAFVAKAQESDHNNIVGGTEVTRGRYPYQVALAQSLFGFSFWGGCGGSLIAPGYVLSAAHCGFDTDFDLVWIGRHNVEDSSEEGYESINVVEKFLHPSYDETTLENDVMILKLESDSTAQVVAYDTGDADTSEGNPVTVMGWGSTTEPDGETSDVLLEVELDIVSNCDCCKRWGGGITDGMMCAEDAEKASCTGDSGGPLIIKGSDAESDMQVGIVSFVSSNGCPDPDLPSGFVRISEYVDWIKCLVDGGTANDCEASASTSTDKGDLIEKMMRVMNL
eukprot:CAMPEP_0178965638 /NCGR_PEP_ID=MMETSP0789-20121207/16429_1 /TAXON_ID=3005 /ORGANISM="Rhizosolenia setigera, Strain CCMP 1694" /LENGTH=296 /DNA_ID=CAMNT_0020650717 /DNA_START=50 /DNA_END=940 /DNA_ORIENTATION=+